MKSEQSSVKRSSRVTEERPTIVRPSAAPLFQEIALSRTSSGASAKSGDRHLTLPETLQGL